MNPETIFLGWDQPCVKLVAAWLCSAPERLRRRLVVVPTRESGRRLRELLAEGSLKSGRGAVLGPWVATPDDFFRPDTTMPDSLRWAGWLKVLRETSDAEVEHLFPNGINHGSDLWCVGVGRQIEQARDQLASADLGFSVVKTHLETEADRWAELASLEAKVGALWQQWGFHDPVLAKRQKAHQPDLPAGVQEIVIAAVPDPTLLAVRAWQAAARKGINVTCLVCAPAGLAGAFDEWGQPKPDFWSDRKRFSVPEPTARCVAADASGLAEAVVQNCLGKSSDEVCVGVCASAFMPAVVRRFQQAGWPTFDPQGEAGSRDGWPELLESLAAAVEAPGDYTAVSRFARHPFAWEYWLESGGASSVFGALDDWEIQHCPGATHLATRLLGGAEASVLKQAGALLKRAGDFVESCRGKGKVLQEQLMAWASKAGDVQERIHNETVEWPRLAELSVPTRLRMLAASLGSMTRDAEHSRDALPLQGWLELPYDPAPHLVLAAMHEGAVPENPSINPLITEVLRERLGFRDRKSRLAREVYLYTAMAQGRRNTGSVVVVTAHVDPTGEPCRPSRVLLHADPAELPGRVGQWFKEDPDIALGATPPWSRGSWSIQPRPGTARNKTWTHLSPSTLRAYLACPTRFYFAKVLRWERFQRFDAEMDAKQFGDLFHEVFRLWGEDPVACALTDPQKLADTWLTLLDHVVTQRYGADLPPLLRLQVMSARERLRSLANVQAIQAQGGWTIVAVEQSYRHLKLAGLPLEMRVDRIDRHADGSVRVIDYKTARAGSTPRQTHLRLFKQETCPKPLGPLVTLGSRNSQYAWTDLQLPLYVRAVQEALELKDPPRAFYALLPEAVSDTDFVEFSELPELLENALVWAETAAQRILQGVFWPPAAEPAYDDFEAIAPDGLEQALGESWAAFLGGDPTAKYQFPTEPGGRIV